MGFMTRLNEKPTNFAMIRQDNAPKRMRINPVEERITTVLSGRSTLKGELRFSEGVKIDCTVHGDVHFGEDDGLCILSKGALVDGTINGPRALIMGEVQGGVDIQGTLVLAPSAVVVGNVRCGKLIVYDGANILGSIETVKSKSAVEEPVLADRDVLPLRRAKT